VTVASSCRADSKLKALFTPPRRAGHGLRSDGWCGIGSQRGYGLRISAASGNPKAAGRAASSGSAGLPAIAAESEGLCPSQPRGAAVPLGSAYVGREKAPTAARSKARRARRGCLVSPGEVVGGGASLRPGVIVRHNQPRGKAAGREGRHPLSVA
jgi:hypothetical protein